MLISHIIARALRLIQAVDPGRQPTATESADALEAFQGFVLSLPGMGLGGAWSDKAVSADYTAGEDERVTATIGGITITLPNLVYSRDASGVPTGTAYNESTMRSPLDGARVQVIDATDATSVFYVWRADKGNWVALDQLTINNDSPFNADVEGYLPAMLALWIAPEYSDRFSPLVLQQAEDGMNRVRARYRRSMETTTDAALLQFSHGGHGCLLPFG